MKKILLATSNRGKIREIIEIFHNLPFELVPYEMNVEETGHTFEENAMLKAKAVAEITGEMVLADDSGLCVDALSGRPGVYSKRYGATDASRIIRLLDELKSVPSSQRTAHFISAVAVVDESGRELISEGQVDGWIVDRPMGVNGFGYDPVFYCPELGKTFGEATEAEKNQVSHRARALEKMKELLSEI